MRTIILAVASLLLLGGHPGPATAMSPAPAAPRFEYNVAKPPGPSCARSRVVSLNLNGNPNRYRGAGCVNKHSNIQAVDGYPDGYSIAVQWRLGDNSRRGLCRNSAGFANNDRGCNKNFHGKHVWIRVGRCDKTPTRSCRRPRHYADWSRWDHQGRAS